MLKCGSVGVLCQVKSTAGKLSQMNGLQHVVVLKLDQLESIAKWSLLLANLVDSINADKCSQTQ